MNREFDFNIYDGDARVSFVLTEEDIKEVLQKIVFFMKRTNCHSGEGLYQSDKVQEESLELVSDILDDIIKPKITWKDDNND